MQKTTKSTRDPEAAASAAYLRLLGATQASAAAAVGVSERTLRNWEGAPWWPATEATAGDRWLKGAKAATRAALLAFVSTDPATCRFAAERLIPELAPPKTRTSVEIEDDGPLRIHVIALPAGKP